MEGSSRDPARPPPPPRVKSSSSVVVKKQSTDSIKTIKTESSGSTTASLHAIAALNVSRTDVVNPEEVDADSLIMADGLNQIRAMRISEIMTDFRNIESQIFAIRVSPDAAEYNEDGFVVLRRCVAQAQSVLQQPFNGEPAPGASDEQVKTMLKKIIVDAAIRRFRAQMIAMQANAARRWVQRRQQVLKGGRPNAGNAAALQQLRNILRTEIAAVTFPAVFAILQQADDSQGKWTQEDPPLAVIQRIVTTSQ